MPTKHRSTIHKFPGRLPYNVNVVRDVNWSEDTDTPTGHPDGTPHTKLPVGRCERCDLLG